MWEDFDVRIIGGEYRSRILKTPPGRSVRPTSDRLRETLFNVLGAAIEGKVFADLYAGSGAVGIEALSRGAARALFVESDRRAAAVIRENLRRLGLEARAAVLVRPVIPALRDLSADVVFLDPPYQDLEQYEAVLSLLGAAPPSLVVAEHAQRRNLRARYGALRLFRTLKQGDSALSFYRQG